MKNLKRFCEGHKICIYGAGVWGKLVFLYLDEANISVAAFLVSKIKSEKHENIFNTPVVGLADYEERNVADKKIIVAVSKKFREEIIENLNNKNISEYYIITDEEIRKIEKSIRFIHDYGVRNNINVLLYHRVENLMIDPRRLSVSTNVFEEHIKYFAEKYNVLRSDENWTDDPDSIVITFDDGHYDFYKNVVPLLEKYKVPATIFITTGTIDEPDELWGDELERIIYCNSFEKEKFKIWNKNYSVADNQDKFETMITLRNMMKNMPSDRRRDKLDELKSMLNILDLPRATHRIMTSEEIRRCSESKFVTIGAHTVTHCSLAHESSSRQLWEIRESKRRIEAIIKKDIVVFAYPYGEDDDFTDETITIAESNGFKRIFAVQGGMTSANYKNGYIPRNNVSFCKDRNSLERRLKFCKYIL